MKKIFLSQLENILLAETRIDHLEWSPRLRTWKVVGVKESGYKYAENRDPFEAITQLKPALAFLISPPSSTIKALPTLANDQKVVLFFISHMSDEELVNACTLSLRAIRFIPQESMWEVAGKWMSKSVYFRQPSLRLALGALFFHVKPIEITAQDEYYMYLKNYFPTLGEPYTNENGLQTRIPLEFLDKDYLDKSDN